ncbi:MAG TPA: hypothetical protein EYP98_06020 [Planctomycetes bacterium]|nr:hypothetical protein [Planctomycetota bacterium]
MKADPVWVDAEVRTGSEQVLYQAILDGIARSRFTIGGGANKAAAKAIKAVKKMEEKTKNRMDTQRK